MSSRNPRDPNPAVGEKPTEAKPSLTLKVQPIPTDSIIRIEARDDYVLVVTPTRQYLESFRMHQLEARLAEHGFLRIHRSHLVNAAWVEGYESHVSGRLRVKLRNGTSLFASRSRSRLLRSQARIAPSPRRSGTKER